MVAAVGRHCRIGTVNRISRPRASVFIAGRYYLADTNIKPVTEHRYSSTSREPSNRALIRPSRCGYNGRRAICSENCSRFFARETVSPNASLFRQNQERQTAAARILIVAIGCDRSRSDGA